MRVLLMIRLSRHAKNRCRHRKVPPEVVQQVMSNPDKQYTKEQWVVDHLTGIEMWKTRLHREARVVVGERILDIRVSCPVEEPDFVVTVTIKKAGRSQEGGAGGDSGV
jgi:hypothetical protein